MKKQPAPPPPFKPLKWDVQMKEAAKRAAQWQPPIKSISGGRHA